MNVFAKFDEIPSMILEVFKETKRYGHTVGRTDGWTDGHSDNVKTVYPPTNTVCGGYNYKHKFWLQMTEGFEYKSREPHIPSF